MFMEIQTLEVKNFRCFKEAIFHFVPGVNLIVGENGVGKSSILEALSVALGAWGYVIDARDTRLIEDHEVRRAKHDFDAGSNYEPQYPCEIQAEGTLVDKKIYRWQRMRKKLGETTKTWNHKEVGGYFNFIDYGKSLTKKIQDGEPILLPLIACYSAGRMWRDVKLESVEPREDQVTRLSRLEGYRECFHCKTAKSDFNRWVFKEELFSIQGGDTSVYLTFKEILFKETDSSKMGSGVFDGFDELSFDFKEEQAFLRRTNKGENGEIVLLNHLSDGQRTLLTFLGDLVRRACLLNPQLGAETLAKTCGVVLIDELELHLHPRWQRQIIPLLERIFPKVQFICTTHSPQIIGEANSNGIHLLKENRFHQSPSGWGADSNWILSNLMEASPRNGSVEDTLRNIEILIDDKKLIEAEALLESLSKKMGSEEGEILRLKTSIENIRVLSDEIY